jgi:hypothetical protein
MEDGKNGMLVDFFSATQLADRVEEALGRKDRGAAMREAARNTILERYALRDLLPKQLKLYADLAAGRIPPDVPGTAPAGFDPQQAPAVAAVAKVAAAAIKKPPVRKKTGRPKNLPRHRRSRSR